MIVNDSFGSDGSIDSIKDKRKDNTSEESKFQKKIKNFRLKKNKEKIKKEQIVQKIFEESESKQVSENEAEMVEDKSDDSEKSKKEQKISDYIKQKLGKRKRKKLSEANSKDANSITDFFDRGDKRKSKSKKIISTILSSSIEENKKEKEKDKENKEDKDDKGKLTIFKEEKKVTNLLSDSDEENKNIDVLLSSDSENEEKKRKKKVKEQTNSEFEDIKKKMNNVVPNLINEIKNLDTQTDLLKNDDFNIILDDDEETNSSNKNKNKINNRANNNANTNNNHNMDIEEDEDDLIEMSSLEGFKKIHITFYGYKLMPNKEFVRIYPLTLEVPETAKFKTIFKAYCAGTNLKEDDMLFNYNNIEIFSTSTLRGLDMTSTLENYRIDVFYRVEYPTYKYQLKVQQIFREEKKKEEQKREEMQKMRKMEFENSTFDDDDLEDSNERIITLFIQDKNKKETKLIVNMNDTIKKLGSLYLKELSLSPTLLPKLQFYFDGQKLNPEETLKKIDIDNQDILDLKIDN